MLSDSHGISIGIDKRNSDYLVSVKAFGKLTHEDYRYMTPMLEGALEKIQHNEVNVMVDLSEFSGWELRAAWDDLQLGLKHGSEFSKIALWGKSNWGNLSAEVASWFLSGEIKYFQNKEDANLWLSS